MQSLALSNSSCFSPHTWEDPRHSLEVGGLQAIPAPGIALPFFRWVRPQPDGLAAHIAFPSPLPPSLAPLPNSSITPGDGKPHPQGKFVPVALSLHRKPWEAGKARRLSLISFLPFLFFPLKGQSPRWPSQPAASPRGAGHGQDLAGGARPVPACTVAGELRPQSPARPSTPASTNIS